ncbi:ABC transporter permease [Microbacterium lacticum]
MSVITRGSVDTYGSRLLRALHAELRKVIATRGTRVVLIVLVAAWACAALAIAALTLSGGAGVNVVGALMGMSAFVITLAPILGILIMVGDWQSRDVVTLFALEPRREIVFWAKVAAAAITGLVVIVAAGIVAIVASVILAAIAQAPLVVTLTGTNTSEMLLGSIVAVLTGIAYGAAIPRVAVAVTLALLQGLAIDPLLAIDPSGIGRWFRLAAIADLGGDHGAIGPAVTAGILFVILPIAVGLVRTRRADIR